jgi:tripartite-type tricarboxylate transporter receptor subunit TctC
MEPLATSPEEFSAEIREATHRWPQVVKAMGLPPQ